MSPQLARSIVRLYSKQWRARYGDEFLALLESLPPSADNVVDACLPALSRHATRAAIALAIMVCAAASVAGTVRHVQPRTTAYAQAACLPNPKISHSAFAGWHRCLD